MFLYDMDELFYIICMFKGASCVQSNTGNSKFLSNRIQCEVGKSVG